MGLFTKVDCAICGENTGAFSIKDKQKICKSCFKKAGFKMTTPTQKMTKAEVVAVIQEKDSQADELASFVATRKIGNYLQIDEAHRKWLVPSSVLGSIKKSKVYNFDDVVSFELIENRNSVASGGVGRALVGGALFGGVGAVVGASTAGRHSELTSLKLKITVNDLDDPVVFIQFIMNGDPSAYKSAQKCLAIFEIMCRR